MNMTEHEIQLLVDIANHKKSEAKGKAAQEINRKYFIGKNVSGLKYQYQFTDVKAARQQCINLGIDINDYNPNQASRRAEVGMQRVKEKNATLSIFNDFCCIKTLRGTPKVNGKDLIIPDMMMANIRKQDLKSIAADALMIVENLETFLDQLPCLKLEDPLPSNTLAMFRGSPQFGGNLEKIAKKLCNRLDITRIGFFDYDISGLIKCHEQKYDYMLLPIIEQITERKIKGNPDDLRSQSSEAYLKSKSIPAWLKPHFDFFDNIGGSFTQERLIAHGISFSLLAIKDFS